LEVCFTGVGAAMLRRDRSGTARTYLWMHPIYGGTALALELLHDRLRPLPRPVRALAYTAVIFGSEFTTGWLLRKALGRCPWDYERQGWSVRGLIRLDYAPFWYATGLLFEPLREGVLRLTSEALRQTPEYRHAVEEGTVPEHPHVPSEPVELEAGEIAEDFLVAEEAEAHPGA
jgi:hypothetical protein